MIGSSRKIEVLTAAGTGLYAACGLGYLMSAAHQSQAGPMVMFLLFGVYAALGALRLVEQRPDPTVLASWTRAALVFFAMLFPLAASPEGRLVWSGGWWLAGSGAVLGILAVVALGSNFDVVPAVRGIVCRGPYQVIRHPGVTSVLLMAGGFLLVHWSPWNAAVLGLTIVVGVVTAFAEEDLLRRDERYVDYSARVRWRFIPGVA
jgi:protein-S-isoprenylcysteine O-methyltransferase Ste14